MKSGLSHGSNGPSGKSSTFPRIDDARLAEVFTREVLAFLVGRELLSREWPPWILSWQHTGFSVHSRVRARTKAEAERVGQYMTRPVLSLERLSLHESEAKVSYRYGQVRAEQEAMDYLEFIARVTSHIPDKGQVMVRYYGLYANAHRGKVRKAGLNPFVLRMAEEDARPVPSKGWAEMIRKVYEADPLVCPKCGGLMKVVAFITNHAVVDRIIDHLKLTFVAERPQPRWASAAEAAANQARTKQTATASWTRTLEAGAAMIGGAAGSLRPLDPDLHSTIGLVSGLGIAGAHRPRLAGAGRGQPDRRAALL
ncbi:MAG: transposase, partial [Candidatus Aminicenantales bacterium]